MKRTILAMALVGFTAAAAAPRASAQSPVSLGIAAGAAIPVGDFADFYNSGYNVTATLGLGSFGSPVGFRVDGMYNKFMGREEQGAFDDASIVAGTGNLVFNLPGVGITPYLIGGGGIYGVKIDRPGQERETNFGVNGGIGAKFPLSGFNAFLEARYHHIFTKDALDEDSPTQFIPVTFGISF